MDYEKKYNKALAWMREVYPELQGAAKEDAEHYFPELKESEDERIRSAMIRGFNSMMANQPVGTFAGESIRNILSYLEKQKEQKHDATDAKSERVIKAARSVLNNWLDGTDCPDVSGDFAELEYAIRKYDGEEKQKEQKPAEVDESTKRLNDNWMKQYFDDYKEQKPAEVDESTRDEI